MAEVGEVLRISGASSVVPCVYRKSSANALPGGGVALGKNTREEVEKVVLEDDSKSDLRGGRVVSEVQ